MDVIVFDLDDTLYAEQDFTKSSQQYLIKIADKLYGKKLSFDWLKTCDDFIAAACDAMDIPQKCKNEILWLVRNHKPNIVPFAKIHDLFAHINKLDIKTAIISDGRSITQRQKIKALNIDVDVIFISDEIGYAKPNPHSFEQIMQIFPDANYHYIADNPTKDFISPNKLGWRTLGVLNHDQRVHPINLSLLEQDYLPQMWFDTSTLAAKYLMQ